VGTSRSRKCSPTASLFNIARFFAGMTSEPHDAYDQTAMGDPVDEQGQVQYHHQTVTGHPDEGVYKVEVAEINPIHHHNHQEV